MKKKTPEPEVDYSKVKIDTRAVEARRKSYEWLQYYYKGYLVSHNAEGYVYKVKDKDGNLLPLKATLEETIGE